MRKHHEVVVALAQFHLVVLELGLLADVYASEAEKSTDAGTENPGKRNALRQVSVPEDVHLFLLLLLLRPHQSFELEVGESRLQRTRSRPFLRFLPYQGRRLALVIAPNVLLLGVVGLGELEDGIDHELVISPC